MPLERGRFSGYIGTMDNDVHRRPRDQMTESGKPFRADLEKLGPDLRGKSLAEIAAILMNVPTRREDSIDDPPLDAPHGVRQSPPDVPQPSAFTHAPPTAPQTAIAPSPVPRITDAPPVA